MGEAWTKLVRIISPRYEKLCFGIDDTDTKTEGAICVTALKCAEACTIEGVEFLNMCLIQLNPAIPHKTTNCFGSALNFAVKLARVKELQEYVCSFVQEHTFSLDTCIVCYRDIGFTQESPAFNVIQTDIMTLEQAEREAKSFGGLNLMIPMTGKDG